MRSIPNFPNTTVKNEAIEQLQLAPAISCEDHDAGSKASWVSSHDMYEMPYARVVRSRTFWPLGIQFFLRFC